MKGAVKTIHCSYSRVAQNVPGILALLRRYLLDIHYTGTRSESSLFIFTNNRVELKSN